MSAYDRLTVESKFKIKRFTHERRFQLGARLCEGASSLLDYGTGSAYFLKVLAKIHPGMELVGYEPMPELMLDAQAELRSNTRIKIVNTLNELGKFDCVTCFEVLEHLTEEDQRKVLTECRKMVNERGKIIISVPIETGLASLAKNFIRYLIRQEHATSIRDIVKCALGKKIERKVEGGYIYPHTGFSFQELEKLFARENLKITKRITSPFAWAGPGFNSQLFYIFESQVV